MSFCSLWATGISAQMCFFFTFGVFHSQATYKQEGTLLIIVVMVPHSMKYSGTLKRNTYLTNPNSLVVVVPPPVRSDLLMPNSVELYPALHFPTLLVRRTITGVKVGFRLT